jgi:DNA-binding transcriptional LysR family regulator
MELRQLHYFTIVAEELSFTQAARRLHVSQSSVSTTVSALERELKVMLFVRTTQKVSLTEEGVQFLRGSREVLSAAEQAREDAQAAKFGLAGRVRIAIIPALLRRVVDMASQFHKVYPNVLLSLVEVDADGVAQAVAQRTLDFATLPLGTRTSPAGVMSRQLLREECVAILPPDSEAPPEISLAELAEYGFIDFIPGWALRQSVDSTFRAARLTRNTRFEVSDVPVAVELVKAGLGACILPISVATLHSGIKVSRIGDFRPEWNVVLIWPKGPMRPAVRELMSIFLRSLPIAESI